MKVAVGVPAAGAPAAPLGARSRPGESVWPDYVRRIAADDQQALGALYDETIHLIFSAALRILGNTADAEEATLDVYTQVWRSASKFNPERGSVLAWLMTIARSRSLDKLRSGNARARREEPLNDYPDLDVAVFPQQTLGLERMVRNALATLEPEQREVIELAYFSGLTHSELAAKLGQPLGTVKTRIRTGMMKLRSMLVDTEPAGPVGGR